jgi:hypothetical protein
MHVGVAVLQAQQLEVMLRIVRWETPFHDNHTLFPNHTLIHIRSFSQSHANNFIMTKSDKIFSLQRIHAKIWFSIGQKRFHSSHRIWFYRCRRLLNAGFGCQKVRPFHLSLCRATHRLLSLNQHYFVYALFVTRVELRCPGSLQSIRDWRKERESKSIFIIVLCCAAIHTSPHVCRSYLLLDQAKRRTNGLKSKKKNTRISNNNKRTLARQKRGGHTEAASNHSEAVLNGFNDHSNEFNQYSDSESDDVWRRLCYLHGELLLRTYSPISACDYDRTRGLFKF